MDNSNNKKVDTPSQEKSQNELAPMMALYDPRYYSSAPFGNPNIESMKPLPSIKVELSPIKDILPSISSAEVASRPFDYALPSFLTKPEPPPLLPRITSLLSPESIPQVRKLPSSPSPSPNASPLIPPIQSTKQWKQDDVSDVAIALEQLRSIAQGRPSEPEPTMYSNDSDVSPPNEVEDSLDSRKRPLAAVGTPVIITTIQTSTGEITSSFIKAKPKKKRRKAEQIDRKFPCDYLGCPKSYGSEGALKTHRRLKHPELPVDGQIIQTQPTSTTPTALQHVQAVQIHPSQLLQHYANGGSIVQLLPPPQVLNSSPMQGSVLTLVHQPTPNTVA